MSRSNKPDEEHNAISGQPSDERVKLLTQEPTQLTAAEIKALVDKRRAKALADEEAEKKRKDFEFYMKQYNVIIGDIVHNTRNFNLDYDKLSPYKIDQVCFMKMVTLSDNMTSDERTSYYNIYRSIQTYTKKKVWEGNLIENLKKSNTILRRGFDLDYIIPINDKLFLRQIIFVLDYSKHGGIPLEITDNYGLFFPLLYNSKSGMINGQIYIIVCPYIGIPYYHDDTYVSKYANLPKPDTLLERLKWSARRVRAPYTSTGNKNSTFYKDPNKLYHLSSRPFIAGFLGFAGGKHTRKRIRKLNQTRIRRIRKRPSRKTYRV
jgi:hypothetical protein